MNAAPPPGDDPAGRQERFLSWPDGTPAHIAIPDDLAELDADVAAFHRERAQRQRAARPARWSRWVPRSWRRYGVTAPLLVVSMLLMGAFGTVLMIFGPRGRIGALGVPAPLAAPSVPAGHVGGLLPDVALRTLNNSPVGSRELRRPSLALVLPSDCQDCAAIARHVSAASESYATLARYVIARSPSDARRFSATTGRPTEGLVDRGGTLLSRLASSPTTPTVAVIGANGVITALVPGVTPQTPLTEALDKVVSPSLSAGASR